MIFKTLDDLRRSHLLQKSYLSYILFFDVFLQRRSKCPREECFKSEFLKRKMDAEVKWTDG